MREVGTRALAAVCLAAVASLAWLEWRSCLAQTLRAGRPLLAWVALAAPGTERPPALCLAVYQPLRRTLDLVAIPGSTKTPDNRTLDARYAEARRGGADPAAATRALAEAAAQTLAPMIPSWSDWPGLLLWRGTQPAAEDEPPLVAARWLLRRSGPRLWSEMLRAMPGVCGPAGRPWDRLLLVLELQRLRPDSIRPAWLPPEDQAQAFFADRLDARPPALPGERPTVEVLNASRAPGVASRAKNLLRLRGADVMVVANADAAQERTLVIDRLGRFANAVDVRRMLGCPAARAVTRIDLKRLVDVTVILAEDCPLP